MHREILLKYWWRLGCVQLNRLHSSTHTHISASHTWPSKHPNGICVECAKKESTETKPKQPYQKWMNLVRTMWDWERERERARNQCHQQVNKVSTAQIILLNVSPIHSVNRDSENNQSVENVMAKIIFTILKYAQYECRRLGLVFIQTRCANNRRKMRNAMKCPPCETDDWLYYHHHYSFTHLVLSRLNQFIS